MKFKQLIKLLGAIFMIGSPLIVAFHSWLAYTNPGRTLLIAVDFFGEGWIEILYYIIATPCMVLTTYWFFIKNERWIEDEKL